MGCGKSKHSVETATTIIKSSTNPDGTKQTTATTATKTVKETTSGSSLTETKSLNVDGTNIKLVTDPSEVAKINNVAPTNDVAKTDNVDPTLAANVEEPADTLKEDVKAKDSNPTENVAATTLENVGKVEEVVRGDEKVNSLSQTDATNVSDAVPISGKDEVGATQIVKVDEEKIESTLKADGNVKINNVVRVGEDKTKPDFMTPTKTEFMTPTLSEDVVGPFEAVKGEEEVKDSKAETITTTTSDEKIVKIIDGPSKLNDDNLKVKEQKLVLQASESTKVEAKKEDAVVTESDIAKAKISPATKTEKVPTANGANAAETQKKEP